MYGTMSLKKLQTLKKSQLYIEFLFIRLNNSKFLVHRKSHILIPNSFAVTRTLLPTVAALFAPPSQQYGQWHYCCPSFCHLPGTYGAVSCTIVISSYTTSQLGSSHTTRAAHTTLSSPSMNDKSIPPTVDTHLQNNTPQIPTDILISTFPFIKLLHYA
jgi:hypothetical protein